VIAKGLGQPGARKLLAHAVRGAPAWRALEDVISPETHRLRLHHPAPSQPHRKHSAGPPASGTSWTRLRGWSTLMDREASPMRRLALILSVSLAMVATSVPTPARAFPMRFGGGMRGHGFVGGHAFPRFFRPFPFIRRPFFRPRFFNQFAVGVPFPIGFSGAWSPFYGYPSPCYGYPGAYGAYDGGTYDPPPAAFTIPATYAAPRLQPVASVPPVPPPPMPEVVEYSTGRYQLRDDG